MIKSWLKGICVVLIYVVGAALYVCMGILGLALLPIWLPICIAEED